MRLSVVLSAKIILASGSAFATLLHCELQIVTLVFFLDEDEKVKGFTPPPPLNLHLLKQNTQFSN